MMRWRTFTNLFTVAALGLVLAACSAKQGAKGAGGVDGSGSGDYSAGIGLGTLDRVYFEFDASTITASAAETLQKNAKTIKGNPKMKVLVEGHCDERGTNEYNIALGERRAKATLDYLVSLGVDRSRLDKKSWGEERPLDMGQSEASYKKNRRAEFVILAK